MVSEYSVVWSPIALNQLSEIYDYLLEKESKTIAHKVIQEITISTRSLPENPFMYEEDSLKINNDKSYRAYHVFSYRITYRIKPKQIYILRIRHTSREPLKH